MGPPVGSHNDFSEMLRELSELQVRHEERVKQMLAEHEHRVLLLIRAPTKEVWTAPTEQQRSKSPSAEFVRPQSSSGAPSVQRPHSTARPPAIDPLPETGLQYVEAEKLVRCTTCESVNLKEQFAEGSGIVMVSTKSYKSESEFPSTRGALTIPIRDDEMRQSTKKETMQNMMKELSDAERNLTHRAGYTRQITVRLQASNLWLQRFSRWCRGVVNHRLFEIVVAGLIATNAVFIGVQVELAMRNPAKQVPEVIRGLEWIYLLCFTTELLFRLFAEGRWFVSPHNKNVSWNIFDAAIVLGAWVDQVMIELFSSSTPNVMALRVLRILRLVRILRVLRVMRFFRDLRVMVVGIVNSVKSLSFALMLLLLVMYIFAVCVLQVAADELEALASGRGELSESQHRLLLDHYSSLPHTIFTLYCSILGGVDWSQVVEPLHSMSTLLTVLFVLYIAFAMLCVLNIITGVFCENANSITAKDEEAMLLKELTRRREWLQEVSQLFSAQDVDGNGEMDWQEFENAIQNAQVKAWFHKIGIDVDSQDSEGLFALLDVDGSGKVSLDDFVTTLLQIHGTAKSIDMAHLKMEVRRLNIQLMEMLNVMKNVKRSSRAGLIIDGWKKQKPQGTHSTTETTSSLPGSIPC